MVVTLVEKDECKLKRLRIINLVKNRICKCIYVCLIFIVIDGVILFKKKRWD